MKIVQIIKNMTPMEVFSKAPEVKKKLPGVKFLGKKYFVNTIGQHEREKIIAKYMKRQGRIETINNCTKVRWS